MDRKIRNSAKALIIKDGRMLAIKLNDNGDEFFIMPGGGQNTGETLIEALKREVAEELGIEIRPRTLQFVIEGVNGEAFHRVDMVFLCDYIGNIKNAVYSYDSNQVGFEWLDIEDIVTKPLYPSKLRRQIKRLYNGDKTLIYLGNEEVGDPEYFED